MDHQTELLTQKIINSVLEEDFYLGIHELLHARHFSFIDKYSYDGKLFARSAVLLEGLCHITVNEDFDCDYILSLGCLPQAVEGGVNNVQITELIDEVAQSCLDEWEEREDGEELCYGNFSCFSIDKLIAAAESKERAEIQPILSTFMEVFSSYSDFFIEQADNSVWANFESDIINDETLEAAFIAFITFIRENIIPKINLAILKPTPDTNLN